MPPIHEAWVGNGLKPTDLREILDPEKETVVGMWRPILFEIQTLAGTEIVYFRGGGGTRKLFTSSPDIQSRAAKISESETRRAESNVRQELGWPS